MTKRTRKIPLVHISEGIKKSLKKSEQFLSDAEDLVSKNSLNNALILIEFAIEEFGRAVALREKLEEGSEEIEEILFSGGKKSHEYKYDKAWSILPNELKTIYEGTFDVYAYAHPPGAEKEDVILRPQPLALKETISPNTRLDATFVNFVNGKWKDGVRAEKETLKRVVKGIRERIIDF